MSLSSVATGSAHSSRTAGYCSGKFSKKRKRAKIHMRHMRSRKYWQGVLKSRYMNRLWNPVLCFEVSISSLDATRRYILQAHTSAKAFHSKWLGFFRSKEEPKDFINRIVGKINCLFFFRFVLLFFWFFWLEKVKHISRGCRRRSWLYHWSLMHKRMAKVCGDDHACHGYNTSSRTISRYRCHHGAGERKGFKLGSQERRESHATETSHQWTEDSWYHCREIEKNPE